MTLFKYGQDLTCFMIAGVKEPPRIDWEIKPEDMIATAKTAIAEAKEKIDIIAQISEGEETFENVVVKLERIIASAEKTLLPLGFMKYVSTDPAQRSAGGEVEKLESEFQNYLWSRVDLYNVVKRLEGEIDRLDGEDLRLYDKILKAFKRKGVDLDEKSRKTLTDLFNKHDQLQITFQKNLNEYKYFVKATEKDLDGVPESVIKALQKEEDHYLLPLDYPVYFPVMENAKQESLRKKMYEAFQNRGGIENTELLKEALSIRKQIADLLGYKNYAEYIIEEKMAKSPDRVIAFLEELKTHLQDKAKLEKEKMRKLKARTQGTSVEKTQLEYWDVSYYHNLILKEDYAIDQNVVREYFPLEVVLENMFHVYQTVLGLRFEEIENPNGWHPDVKQFLVYDRATNKYMGSFFLDLFPREGKFKHAAAFDIVQGTLLEDGKYQRPMAAMVANFTKPTETEPSLLQHREVVVLFHEFGHIMHQIVTEAKYARFSGANTAWDFVEAPSQMLENWVWDKQVLSMLSGHYTDPSKKLPEDIIENMIEAKLLNAGIQNLRQIFFAMIDMKYHLADSIDDPNQIWHDLFEEILTFKPLRNTHPASGFGHIMGGYAAGYYGYLWSKVYAQDMFTRFEESSPLDENVGLEYRQKILAKGGSEDEEQLVINFLGRKPNNKAFLRSLGIKA